MSEPAYEIEPRNKFSEATRKIVEYEIRLGNTVSFLAEVDLTEVVRVRSAAGAGTAHTPATATAANTARNRVIGAAPEVKRCAPKLYPSDDCNRQTDWLAATAQVPSSPSPQCSAQSQSTR